MNGRMLLAALPFTTDCSVQAPRADESNGRASQVVYFEDLDLTDSAAPRLLYERIKVAAMQVCGPVRAHDVAEAWVRPCVSHAIASAVADVNDLQLRDGRFVLDGATRSNSRCVTIRANGGHPGKGLPTRSRHDAERCPARPPAPAGRVPESA